MVLATIGAMAGGCGPDLEEVIRDHKAAIEAKLASFPSIRDQVARLPKLDADSVTPTEAHLVLALDGSSTSSAALVHAEDLANPEELGFVWGRVESSGALNECASIARRGHEAFNPGNPNNSLSRPLGFTATSKFEACEKVTTLLVIRTSAFVQPSAPELAGSAFVPDLSICDPVAGARADGGASDANATESRWRFSGGRIQAEILVFALNGARYEGGFRVEAVSSARLAGTNVEADLVGKLRRAIVEGVKAHIPGATVRL